MKIIFLEFNYSVVNFENAMILQYIVKKIALVIFTNEFSFPQN